MSNAPRYEPIVAQRKLLTSCIHCVLSKSFPDIKLYTIDNHYIVHKVVCGKQEVTVELTDAFLKVATESPSLTERHIKLWLEPAFRHFGLSNARGEETLKVTQKDLSLALEDFL